MEHVDFIYAGIPRDLFRNLRTLQLKYNPYEWGTIIYG